MREPTILISNRGSDSSHYADLLYKKLCARFGSERILKVYSIESPWEMRETVESCDVLVALIGRHWVYDWKGLNNLADEFDSLRLSIATALARGVVVIPVLMPYCSMPRAEDLPEDIRALASLRAIDVDIFTWKKNSDLLCDIIAKLPPKGAPPEHTQTSSAMPASAETLIERARGIELRRTLSGHADFPACLAFSPDGRLLASGSYDQSVRLWDVETGKLLWAHADHWPMVVSVAFSPDGRTLACTGEKRNRGYGSRYGIRLYDVETGQALRGLSGHDNYVNCIAFSPDGRRLASGSNDRTVKLWDLKAGSGKPASRSAAFTLSGHTGTVWALSFSHDGELLASSSSDGSVRIWHLPNRFESRILKYTARTIAFSPVGRLLASDSKPSRARHGDARSRLLLTEVGRGHALREVLTASAISALAWTPDSSVIAIRLENSLQLLHAASGRLIYTQQMPGGAEGRGYVRPLCISPDGRSIATFAGGPTHELQLWDIRALEVGPEAQPRRATAASEPLREHLRTLPLSHAALPTPARSAAWLRSAAATGVRPPLCVVQDLGALLTQPRSALTLERPKHLPSAVDTSAYLNLLTRLAANPLLREVSGWSISDSMTGVVVARLVEGLSFPEIYSLPGGIEAAAFTQQLSAKLSRAEAAAIWRETKASERPSLGRLLPAEALARIESNVRRLDADELRFLHRYGPRLAGTPDPREMLDLFNLMDLPPAVRLAMAQVLRLLPRVSQSVNKSGGMQTYAMGGYAGLTHRGSLDSLVPTELAYPSQMLLHRLLNQEALYYGRESEPERQREAAYILTQAGLDVRGDADVLARALTLAIVEAMQGRGYDVIQSFVGSRWTEPAQMKRPADVQRLLYYRDEGALRPREMLSSVLGQLRAFRERYRAVHIIWVVGEHWDADDCEENRELYASLKSWADQQAWFIRLGAEGAKARRAEPVAARNFGHYQLIESRLLWDKLEPPVVMYAPPAEAQAQAPVEETWVEPATPPSRLMLVPGLFSGHGAEVQTFITTQMRMRGHMVMIDSVLTGHDAWMAGLRNVELVIPMITKESADSAVVVAAAHAARTLAYRGEGPRPLPIRIAYEGPSSALPGGDPLNRDECFNWRGPEDNSALLRAMIEALAPAPSLLRFDGMYHQPFNHPTQLREWFRFYPDGRVISITTTEGTPENATRWLGEELRDGTARVGRYEVNGNRLSMSFRERGDEGGLWSYAGVIGSNTLSLDGTRNGTQLAHTTYRFVAIDDFSVAPPQPPPLRFDGAYLTQVECIDWTHPEKDWSWMAQCVKFRQDGTVYHSRVWSMNTASDFLPTERDERGTYTVEGESVRMIFKSSTGETRTCLGQLRGDDLSVSGPYGGEYHFLAPPAPARLGVRFDGLYTNESMYMDSSHPERGGWDRYTLRFKDDGTVAFAHSSSWGSQVPALREPRADDQQGIYEASETIIEIMMGSASGETRDWYGTIEGDTITLTMDDEVLRQFGFVADEHDQT
ncbi:MAG TPA: hypothetical protein VF553_01525 [Pyrinomonadaceae bacterium]|jgi:hypothetical protein